MNLGIQHFHKTKLNSPYLQGFSPHKYPEPSGKSRETTIFLDDYLLALWQHTDILEMNTALCTERSHIAVLYGPQTPCSGCGQEWPPTASSWLQHPPLCTSSNSAYCAQLPFYSCMMQGSPIFVLDPSLVFPLWWSQGLHRLMTVPLSHRKPDALKVRGAPHSLQNSKHCVSKIRTSTADTSAFV